MRFLKQRKLLFYTYIFLFIILVISVAYITNLSMRDSYMRSILKASSFKINLISQKLQKEADIYFDEVVKQPEILKELSKIDNKENLDEIRKNLIKKLSSSYKRMKENGVRQFQFHTKDNHSFLRMHKIDKFGDSLKGFRYSVEITNSTLKPHHGFEEGRLKNGYRNVYPIIYQGKHLGTVEISFGLQNILQDNFKLMILKSTVQEKVEYRFSTYKVSSINPNFCFEKNGNNNFLISKDVDSLIVDELGNKLESRKDFAIYIESDNKNYLMNFIAVKNLENKFIAYFITYMEDNYISEQLYKQILYFILANSLIFIAILIFFKYRTEVDNYIIHSLVESETNLIFTHQNNKILRINKLMLNFFNLEFEKLEDICDLFIKDDGFLMADNNYCSIINKTSDKTIYRIKLRNSKTNEIHLFSINVSSFRDMYLVVFTDITDVTIVTSKYIFDNQNYRDNLTSLYNRSKFDLDIKYKILKQSTFSLIMMNIDNFSSINKQYGSMVGDIILQEFSKLSNINIRKSDVLYIFDKKNFIIIVDANMLHSTIVSKKLKVLISSNKFYKEIFITVSFGITEFRKLESAESILERVQSALALAKNSGKNCVITV